MLEIRDQINLIDDSHITKPVEIDDLSKRSGETVQMEGAVHKIRSLGNVAFIVIRTIRDKLQVVLDGESMQLLSGLKEGDFVKFSGVVEENPKAYKGQEVRATAIDKLSGAKDVLEVNLGAKELPMNLETKLDRRILTLRHLRERAVFKLQEGVGVAFREYLLDQRFTEIHSPKIVAAGAEGGANIFKLDYFGRPAFLAQSPQFYKQFMVPVYGRVFEVGPVFRAEKHATSRHINEYTSLDFEMGFIDSFRDVMSMEVGFLKYLIGVLGQRYGHELELLGIKLPDISSVPAIKFADAKEQVAKKYNRKYRDPYDLEPEEERLIGDMVKQETGSDFVFLTHYPKAKRPFYTMSSTEDPNYTESFDLLFKGLEITTGGQRIHDYDTQVEALRAKGLNPDDFKDYLELHKNGTPPHGGCGIGLERLTLKLLGGTNVREATLFPRDLNRLTP
ncbi:MAG: aspartate--tRNA(Asn) ligase [Candidatus Gracilibacteria bacterium]|jgi:nondiscriminating aspartyl-tRNA synthetase